MDSIEEIRKRKMQEYMAQQQNAMMQQQFSQEQQIREAQAQIKQVISRILSKEAQERIANIRVGKPDFAMQLEVYLIQLYEQGKIQPPVTDEQLRGFLDQIVQKKETRIIRK